MKKIRLSLLVMVIMAGTFAVLAFTSTDKGSTDISHSAYAEAQLLLASINTEIEAEIPKVEAETPNLKIVIPCEPCTPPENPEEQDPNDPNTCLFWYDVGADAPLGWYTIINMQECCGGGTQRCARGHYFNDPIPTSSIVAFTTRPE
jgi:hypothetical protein